MAIQSPISGQSIVVVGKEQVSCDLSGEAAILHITRGVYYGLDAVGARVWEFIQQPYRRCAITWLRSTTGALNAVSRIC